MNSTIKVFLMLLAASFVFQMTMTYMIGNIGEFETVALPPKTVEKHVTVNPVMKVNATARDTWTLIDFFSGKIHTVSDLEKEKDKLKSIPWDLGFQRTKVITNGGITNPSGVAGVVNMGYVEFDSVAEAPETGYMQDERAWGNIVNKAIGDWYNYRTRTHNVESQKYVYAVRTSENKYFKMRILNYYCKHQESDCEREMCGRDEAACLSIEYVLQPDGGRTFPASVAQSPADNQLVQSAN